MQDRFKFRVFISDKKNSKNSLTGMFKVHSLHTGTNKAIITSLYGNCSIKLENNILMQCTGLKDKNGKLIYEGDVLKGKKNMICSPHSSRMIDKVGVVEIPQNMFVATCQDVKNNCTLFCQKDWVKTEIIGNIYENKELLNEI